MSRTIVIGDIHGCYDELVALLEELDLKAEDRVVAVGDLVVKGPKNRQVLDLFKGDSRFSSVIGNHDLALVLVPTNHLRVARQGDMPVGGDPIGGLQQDE